MRSISGPDTRPWYWSWQRGAFPQNPRPAPPWPQRHSRVAFLLAGVASTLRAARPDALAVAGTSLGAKLRKRRRELGLRRCDAALQMGVSWKTLFWWEHEQMAPSVRAYPAIIRFLAEEPWPSPCSFAEYLQAERRRRGLSIHEAATLLGVDEGTFGRWERRDARLTTRARQQIAQFLGTDV